MTLCDTYSKACSRDVTAGTNVDEIPGDLKRNPDLYTPLRVEPGSRVKLGAVDPFFHADQSQQAALIETLQQLRRIDQLQNMMYAERNHSLLIVLQGLDACGKDGLVRHIVSGLNPGGCRVVAFKQPTAEELRHDFLWRVHRHVPAKGEVVIFNRSHYEDVLAVRVHQLVPGQVWSKRYELINDLERLIVGENHTTILKFLLHISKEEQLARFKRRLEDPDRRWKVSESDYQEREYWEGYMHAFEDMLEKTSTFHAPWFVIPSNHKWFRDFAVSQIIMRTLDQLDLQLPETAVDIARLRLRYHATELQEKCPGRGVEVLSNRCYGALGAGAL
jgi:PPK2 family polyphosphate:nucleotide phosphotransferase